MPDYDYQLAFVDSIAAAPTIRLELTNGTRGPWNLRDGSRFDPPPLKRNLPTTMLMDGSTPSSAAYENRVIELRLQLLNVTKDQAATQLQLLTRELDRPTNILMHRPQTTAPVFFQTFRSGPDAIDWDPVNEEVTVSIMARPFALGLRETASGITVTNDPAAGANGMFFDITSVKGDVETPLEIRFTGGTGLGAAGRIKSALAVRRRGTVANLPMFLQAESMTVGTDTTVQANNVLYSGSGTNFVRVTPGTTAMTTRLTSSARFPSTPSVDARGMYRVFARVKLATASDVWAMRLLYGTTGFTIGNNTVTLPNPISAANFFYVDLGTISIPLGADPVYDGETGVEIPTEGVFLTVQAQRVSGASTLDIDVLVMLPADDRLGFIKWPTLQAFSNDVYTVMGGPRPAAWCRSNAGNLSSTESIELTGGGMMISPGRTNRIMWCRDLGTGTSTAASGTGDAISATSSLSWFYHPRYLAPLRPVAT